MAGQILRHATSRRHVLKAISGDCSVPAAFLTVSLLSHCCALSLAASVHELPAGRRAGSDGTRECAAGRRDAHSTSALRGAIGWVGAPSPVSHLSRTASWTHRSSCSLLAGKQLLPAASLLRAGRPARLSMSGGGVVADPPADFARAKRPELAPDVTLYDGALASKVERVKELLEGFLPASVDLEVCIP